MQRNSKKYISTKEMEWEELGGGVSRKFLGYDNQIMMVKVKFEKGALGAPHQHFHTQATYCVSGKFEFEIDWDAAECQPCVDTKGQSKDTTSEFSNQDWI